MHFLKTWLLEAIIPLIMGFEFQQTSGRKNVSLAKLLHLKAIFNYSFYKAYMWVSFAALVKKIIEGIIMWHRKRHPLSLKKKARLAF